MKTASHIVNFALVSLLWAAPVFADEGFERDWLSKSGGTYEGPSGILMLAYKGEGNIEVTLKTERCRVMPATAEAGTVGEQAAVLNSSTDTTSLVIFFEKNYVVLVALDDFSKSFCEGGQDVGGKYILVQHK